MSALKLVFFILFYFFTYILQFGWVLKIAVIGLHDNFNLKFYPKLSSFENQFELHSFKNHTIIVSL